MTPIAAYYLFTATEHERAVAAAHGPLDRRPPILARVRALLAGLRAEPAFARSA